MNPAMGFPMEMARFPGKIWVVSHKPVAVAAGLGMMGVHRNVIHEKFGNFILLGTILLDAEVAEPASRSTTTLAWNANFASPHVLWGPSRRKGILISRPATPVTTGSSWRLHRLGRAGGRQQERPRLPQSGQRCGIRFNVASLSCGANYKAGVLPGGLPGRRRRHWAVSHRSEVSSQGNRAAPSRRRETIYVTRIPTLRMHAAKRFPHKTIKHVGNTLRPNTINVFLNGMPNVFQPGKSAGLNATFHFTFTGHEQRQATVVIQEQKLTVEGDGHVGQPDLHVTADSQTWIGFLRKGEKRGVGTAAEEDSAGWPTQAAGGVRRVRFPSN